MVQSKQEVRELLEQAGVQLRPHLGQNFLVDPNLMRLLVEKASLRPDDTVLEVGAGTGSLTELLAARCGAVVAVEIDRRLASIASKQLSNCPNVELLCRQALHESKLDMSVVLKLTANLAHQGGRLLLVSNLPYNLASRLLIECVCGELSFAELYFTVQKEVGDRILCAPRKKSYGLLSIVFQAAGQAQRLKNLKPTVFWPQPEVQSSMIAWVRSTDSSAQQERQASAVGSTEPVSIEDLLTVLELAKVLLHYRRKKISSCITLKHDSPLRLSDLRRGLAVVGIDPNRRGEQLTVQEYLALARAINP